MAAREELDMELGEDEDVFDSPLHYVDHKEESFEEGDIQDSDDSDHDEDHPIIEKGEHHHLEEDDVYEDAEHIIPEKSERYEEPHVEGDHVIPSKMEHRHHDVHALPRELWNPDFHGHGDHHSMEEDASYMHHYGHADGIDDEYLEDEEENAGPKLKPKEPAKDDPRLKIPKGKTAAAHDHLIVPKEPVEDDGPRYGQAYEHERKQAIHGQGESAGLAPKHPTKERRTQMPHPAPISERRRPCSAYGSTNRCEGMSCEVDEDCASQCCGQMTKDGSL